MGRKDYRAPHRTATVILLIFLDFSRSVEEEELREGAEDDEALFETSFGTASQNRTSLYPDKSQNPRARNDYDEETAYESYMNPEPGFQSGPGDSTNAD